TLGLDVSMEFAPGALFFAAGGYHHHVGANVWNQRSTPADGLGMAWFELLVPDAEAFDAVRTRATADDDATVAEIDDGIEIADADGISVRVRHAE
ncbi:VOC family protein, partial [Natrinema soli]